MKKLLVILTFFLIAIGMVHTDRYVSAMKEEDNFENYDENFELIFEDENLNLRNFKLKLALFSDHDSYIKKVYIKYSKKYFDKEYFSFDNANFSAGIQKLIDEYNIMLKNNYLYDELDKDISYVQIYKVILSTNKENITKFIEKYPKVLINKV